MRCTGDSCKPTLAPVAGGYGRRVDDLLLITNAAAGSNEDEAVAAAVGVLRASADVRVEATSGPEEDDEVLAGLDGRSVVVAGGDGSLHTVVNALGRADLLGSVRLGLVPLGTGNDFARGVGIPLDPKEAAAAVVAGRTRPIDVIADDAGLLVVNNVHLGVGAQASREARRWKGRLGRLGYVVGAVVAGVRPEFIRVQVTVDGDTLLPRRRVAQVAIGNGPNVGGGTELVPDADPGDGRLIIVVSRTVGPFNRLVYAARLRAGTHTLMKEVSRVTGREVTVTGDGFWVTADGELSGPHQERTWVLNLHALDLFVP